jgi:hypothetical protein
VYQQQIRNEIKTRLKPGNRCTMKVSLACPEALFRQIFVASLPDTLGDVSYNAMTGCCTVVLEATCDSDEQIIKDYLSRALAADSNALRRRHGVFTNNSRNYTAVVVNHSFKGLRRVRIVSSLNIVHEEVDHQHAELKSGCRTVTLHLPVYTF